MNSKKDDVLRALYNEIAESVAEAPDADVVEECSTKGSPLSKSRTTCVTSFALRGRDFSSDLFEKPEKSINVRRSP